MRQLFLYTALALICGLAQAQAAAPSATATLPAAHPLMGSWSWTLPGKQCVESWEFRANGTRTSRSGEEVTQSRYELSPVPSLLGYYRLVETVSESNGKRDCSGDLHEVSDEAVIRYIQLSPKRDQLIVCKEESLKACFGPLKRKPE